MYNYFRLIFILSMILIMLIITNKIYNSFIMAVEKQSENLTLTIYKWEVLK
jgi:hypothetical protein